MKVVKLLGPPGTGKTHALLDIMEKELSSGVPPERLAYLTFTVHARREAVGRAIEKFGFNKDQLRFFRTLHSIAYRELGLNRASMIRDEIKEFGEKAEVDFTPNFFDDDGFGLDVPAGGLPGDKLLAFDHFRRHNLLTVQEAYRRWREDMPFYLVDRFCKAYAAWKDHEALFDFTDLLSEASQPLPVDVVLVDEAQDLSRLQWKALDVFAAQAKRLYIAGDDDQAIFTWAGASPDAFIERPGTIKVLRQSYRLPSKVHSLAEGLVNPIHLRMRKDFRPRKGDAGSVSLVMEPEYVDFENNEGSTLILYRNHYLSNQIEERVRQLGLPYSKSDKPAPGAQWGEAIVLWERLRKGAELTHRETMKVYDAMMVGSLDKKAATQLKRANHEATFTIAGLTEYFGLRTAAPWFDALSRISEQEIEYLRRVIQHHGPKALTATPSIRLSTIHAAKGGQADHVVLLTEVSRKVREAMEENDEDERRVFYVGATRAKQSLTLVGAHNPLF